jgi:hypothetical protein
LVGSRQVEAEVSRSGRGELELFGQQQALHTAAVVSGSDDEVGSRLNGEAGHGIVMVL